MISVSFKAAAHFLSDHPLKDILEQKLPGSLYKTCKTMSTTENYPLDPVDSQQWKLFWFSCYLSLAPGD